MPTRSGKGNPSPLVSNPALMLNQRALCRLLSSENLKSRTTIGHSFGDSVKNANVKRDRKSTRLNSSHITISYAVFCLKKKKIRDEKIAHNYLTTSLKL